MYKSRVDYNLAKIVVSSANLDTCSSDDYAKLKTWYLSRHIMYKEMEPMLAREKADLKEAEERERMQYEKLKAKFEQTGE